MREPCESGSGGKIIMEYKITDEGLNMIGKGLAWLGFWIGLGMALG